MTFMMKFFFLTPTMWFWFMSLMLFSQLLFKETLIIEWVIFNKNNFTFIAIFDTITFIFIFTVTLISFSVLIFSKSYMNTDKDNPKFYLLLLMFIFSMILLIISPNNLSMLLGWDGLGVSSYLLVIYYNSNKANTSGMITLLINRLGDALILSALAIHCQTFIWTTSHLMYNNQTKMLTLFLILGLITKSAQIPFSSWLPAAMAAPTPVSSLVHSSTLVTAGIYMMIRMSNLFKKINFSLILLFLGSLTTSMASLLALKENDMKKIVALSTLSQLGFMVTMLGLNCWLLAFTHLINHAFFKALLFISTGNMIHSSSDSQDLKMTGNKQVNMFNSLMMVFIVTLAMTGITFMSAFFAKEIMLESMSLNLSSSLILLLFMMNLLLTPLYSIRSLTIFFFTVISNFTKSYSENSDGQVQISMMILLMPAFTSGFLINKSFYFKEEAMLSKNNYFLLAVIMIMAIIMTMWIMKFLKYFKNFMIHIFHTTMWGLTQIFMITFPLTLMNTPKTFINVEKKYLTYAFNVMFHESTSRSHPTKIYLNIMLLTLIFSLIFLIFYYLNNKFLMTSFLTLN